MQSLVESKFETFHTLALNHNHGAAIFEYLLNHVKPEMINRVKQSKTKTKSGVRRNATEAQVPRKGLIAWFKSRSIVDSSEWRSEVGDIVARPTHGSVTVSTEAGHGATIPVKAVGGSSESGYDFGHIVKEDFTVKLFFKRSR